MTLLANLMSRRFSTSYGLLDILGYAKPPGKNEFANRVIYSMAGERTEIMQNFDAHTAGAYLLTEEEQRFIIRMIMQPDESLLVRECLKGNEAAWGKLVDQYGRLVYSIPYRHGLAASDADEVFQNVFVIVYRQLAQLRNLKTLAAWLITITYRETIRVSRTARPQLELGETLPDPATPPAELVQRWERQHAVQSALNQLQSPCRELLKILFLEDPVPSYDEIAERLGMPKGSIGPTRGRCLKRLEAIVVEMRIDLD